MAAINSVGTSLTSSTLLILAATKPDPPLALTTDNANTNVSQVVFYWTAPINNSGSPITGYKVYWNAGITGGSMIVYDFNFTAGTSLTVSGCTAGT